MCLDILGVETKPMKLGCFAALTHVGWFIWYPLALVVPSGNKFFNIS